MFKKFATATIIGAEIARPDAFGLVKAAHRAVFDYEPKPGFLYVRSRMISSRCNDNWDEFPAEEIRASWKTAKGKPAFVNHVNEDHRRMRGVIIDAVLHEDTLPDGRPDTWIEVLHEIDAVRFPKLAKAIIEGRVNRTSMGCDVGFSVCSACGNKASTPAEYCFLPGTLITMADGTLKPIEQIAMGDRVLTHDGPGTVTAPMERHYNGPMSRLYRDAYAAPLYLTHGHQVLANLRGRRDESAASAARYTSVHQSDNWAWTASERVDVGNWLQGAYPTETQTVSVDLTELAPDVRDRDGRAALGSVYRTGTHRGLHNWGRNTMPRWISNENESLAFVVGLFTAEGSLETARTAEGTPKTITWSLGAHEDDLVHDLRLHLDKLGAGTPKVYARGGGIQVRLSNAPLAALLATWVGTGARDKHLAGPLMLAPEGFQRAFLDAYYRGDGWEDPGGHVEVRTAGGRLARQMVMLGARCDASVPTWWENRRNPGGPTDRRRLGTIHHLGMGRHGAMQGRRRLHEGYFANRVRAAEHDWYHGPVHNFEVADRHSYVAEGVVVHNCQHIPRMKGQILYRHTASGQREGHLIREICHKLSFFENSFLVEDPADPTAVVTGVDDRGLKTTASMSGQQELFHVEASVAPSRRLSRRSASLAHGDAIKVFPRDGKWVVADVKGSTLSAHDTKVDAERHRATLYRSQPDAGDRSGVQNPGKSADTPVGIVRARTAMTEAHQVLVDEPDSDRSSPVRMVQFPGTEHGGTMTREDGRWLAEDDDGMVVHEHRDHKKALRGLADHHGLHGPLEVSHTDERTWKVTNYTVPPSARRKQSSSSLPRVAYGEVRAPADVDTLRTESCPVCGESDSFDGDRCQVCNFIQPPDIFTDPDTGVAKQMDLRKDDLEQPQIGPDGQPIEGVPDGSGDPNMPNGMDQDMQGLPGTPGDQIADLFCPACGFSADTQAPMTNNDPSAPSEQQGLLEGDVCPNCEQATMLSPNDVGEMGGQVPQEVADDADADGIPDDQEPDTDQDGVPDDAEPDVDEDQIPDDAEPDQDGDGVPDDAQAGEGGGGPGPADEGQKEEPPLTDAVEDDEGPQKGRKDNSRRANRRGHEREQMNQPNQPNKAATEASSMIAALQRKVAVQDRTIRTQAEILKIAGQQLHYLATVAGVSREFEAIKAEGMKKIADIMNPAQPIPDPPSAPPTETTQQAEAPKTFDDPRNPGITPGSTDGVPAQQVDSPLVPGETLPTSPYTNLVDVTQPVAGTEEHVPLDQTKIETDVRVGDPMVNANNPQGYGFPLTGPFAADGAASANTTTSPGYQNPGRTMASIRLAKLRKSAGLVQGDADELVLAAEIERTAALTDPMIEHEIATLATLATKSAAKAQVRRPKGGPMPKVATSERRAPSLAGVPDPGFFAVAAAGFDEDDASDLFLGV